MTSNSFRSSMNSLGWSRREEDPSAATDSTTPILSKISSFNPFRQTSYVQLPVQEPSTAPLPAPSRREEEEGWFARALIFWLSTQPPPPLCFRLPFHIPACLLIFPTGPLQLHEAESRAVPTSIRWESVPGLPYDPSLHGWSIRSTIDIG